MNYKMIVNIIGKIMVIMALLMLLPLTVSLIYFEPSSASNPTPIDGVRNIVAFAVPIVLLFLIGLILNKSFNKNNIGKIGVKEGIIIVSLTWILMSLFGAVPFMISGALPNFFDAFFEQHTYQQFVTSIARNSMVIIKAKKGYHIKAVVSVDKRKLRQHLEAHQIIESLTAPF